MSLPIEQMYQEIGEEALSLAEGLAGKLLVYAEVQDGVISADVFYVNQGGFVRFLSGSRRKVVAFGLEWVVAFKRNHWSPSQRNGWSPWTGIRLIQAGYALSGPDKA